MEKKIILVLNAEQAKLLDDLLSLELGELGFEPEEEAVLNRVCTTLRDLTNADDD